MKIKLHLPLIVFALFAGVDPTFAQLTNLGIAPVGRQSLIYWPTSSTTNYVLQTTASLASPNWVTATNAVAINAVMVTNAAPSGYFRLLQSTNATGMVLIPAGVFTMGDNLDSENDAIPVTVTVSAFYMDVNLVSYSQWQAVYPYATNHGYILNPGACKASNHPVWAVDWYDAVKWCNARSQQAGLMPVYYTDLGYTKVFTNGDNGTAVYLNSTNNGYRLPTEAEWEKAARGGLSGQRFPWGDTISESLANYVGATNSYIYDLGPDGSNPAFTFGGNPFTSPAGYFAANGYGLFDMAGNMNEWCWDWYNTPYAGGSNPLGPASSPIGSRVLRGGAWGSPAYNSRCAFRNAGTPDSGYFGIGFRCVRGQ